MAQNKRRSILLGVAGLVFLIGGISMMWLDPEREGFRFSLTPWSIFLLALAVLQFILMRKSKVNTKGADSDKADQA